MLPAPARARASFATPILLPFLLAGIGGCAPTPATVACREIAQRESPYDHRGSAVLLDIRDPDGGRAILDHITFIAMPLGEPPRTRIEVRTGFAPEPHPVDLVDYPLDPGAWEITVSATQGRHTCRLLVLPAVAHVVVVPLVPGASGSSRV